MRGDRGECRFDALRQVGGFADGQGRCRGWRRDIALDDLLAVSPQANLRERKARQIVDQVRAAVESWPAFAAEAEVSDEFATKIGTLVK